jgi:hypothetical protein
VGVFRPAEKVTDPNGRSWEIYVSRSEPPGSGVRIVEAFTFWPTKESYSWTTTGDHVQRVVRQVARGLEQGELARPLGATFHGAP